MPAKRLRCQTCKRMFWAARSDTKYCGRSICRSSVRLENAKFECPTIPRSGVEGVTFNRLRKRWMVSIRTGDGWPRAWKYVGSFKNLKQALRFHAEVMGASVPPLALESAGQTARATNGG